MQRDEDGDYEDREGENMYAETEDPYITQKQYKCEKCNKKKTEKHSTLFAPFCCNRPMKLTHKLEHKFDFESLTKRYVEKEKAMFPGSSSGKKSNVKTSKAKKTKLTAKSKVKPTKKSKPSVKKAKQPSKKSSK